MQESEGLRSYLNTAHVALELLEDQNLAASVSTTSPSETGVNKHQLDLSFQESVQWGSKERFYIEI